MNSNPNFPLETHQNEEMSVIEEVEQTVFINSHKLKNNIVPEYNKKNLNSSLSSNSSSKKKSKKDRSFQSFAGNKDLWKSENFDSNLYSSLYLSKNLEIINIKKRNQQEFQDLLDLFSHIILKPLIAGLVMGAAHLATLTLSKYYFKKN